MCRGKIGPQPVEIVGEKIPLDILGGSGYGRCRRPIPGRISAGMSGRLGIIFAVALSLQCARGKAWYRH